MEPGVEPGAGTGRRWRVSEARRSSVTIGGGAPSPSQFGGGSLPGTDFQFTVPVQISKNFWRAFRVPTLGAWNIKLERKWARTGCSAGRTRATAGYHLSSNQNGTREANPAIYIPGASTVGNTRSRRRVQDISTDGRLRAMRPQHEPSGVARDGTKRRLQRNNDKSNRSQ
jgi:hypothetical protein